MFSAGIGKWSRAGVVAALSGLLMTMAAVPAGMAAAGGTTTGGTMTGGTIDSTVALTGPQTVSVGHRFDVTLVARADGLAAFSATLRYDGVAVEMLNTTYPQALSGARGSFMPLSVVETANRTVVAGWSCSGPGCAAAAADRAVHGATRLVTVELLAHRTGRVELRADGIELADRHGARLQSDTATSTFVQVGTDRTVVAAPHGTASSAATTSTASTQTASTQAATTQTGVTALAELWVRAQEGDASCAHTSCVDIATLQQAAASVSQPVIEPVTRPSGHAFARPLLASANTFVVNSTNDGADVAIDGTCQTATAGQCTLRAAIQEANHAAGAATIDFAIAGAGFHTIAPGAALPALTNPSGITIDGYSQSGTSPNTDPLVDNAVRTIELVGTGPQGIDGFFVVSGGNTIRGLIMHAFDRDVWIYGENADNNYVVGDMLGLTATGGYDPTQALYGPSSCVVIQGSTGGASYNHVGTSTLGDRNTIGSCNHQGVALYNIGTNYNYIQNNIIGIDPTGTQRRGVMSHGIDINTGSQHTMIGGPDPGDGNLVGGNDQEGVEISHNPYTLYNDIIGNRIGTDPTGNTAPAYAQNHQWGVHLEGYPNCQGAPCPEDAGYNVVTDNVIVNAARGGIMIDKGVHDSVVARNKIGVTANGTPAGNGLFGININGGSVRNVIGPGNEIAFNDTGIQIESDGVEPPNAASSVTNRNTIMQNSIHDNGVGGQSALGIDLAPYGSVNTAASADPNVNDAMLPPVLANAHAAYVDATTCPSCTVELFVADRSVGFGSGSLYLASAVADATGAARVFVPATGRGQSVTATATSPAGSTSEFSKNVLVPAPNPTNLTPVAVFTSNCSHLTCSFNASGSHDPDGSIIDYAWNFGDGTTGDGLNVQHTFTAGGDVTVSLTVTDGDAATAVLAQTASPVDLPPSASFTPSCTFGVCTFDATASSDPDGPIASYAWDFGDGTNGSGATAARTYAASGSYTVVLTVDDGNGMTNSVSHTVSVTALPAGTLAYDTFTRSVANGWGTADVGGAYNTAGTSSDFSVASGTSRITLGATGLGNWSMLPQATARDTDMRVDIGTNIAPNGGAWGEVAGPVARHLATTLEYRLRLRFQPGGAVKLSLAKVVNSSTEVQIGNELPLPGVTYAPGQMISTRLRVTGVNPTLLQAKAWLAGTSEPAAWTVSQTDSQPELQVSAMSGIRAFLGAGSTGFPITWNFDNLAVQVIDSPPTAAFTSSCVNSVCTFDANASSDPDDSVASYAWDFGDGTAGTGVKPVHDYGSAGFGTHTVTLTVTDHYALTSTIVHDVDVENALPVAVFTATCPGLKCSFDAGTSNDPDGSVASYAWDFGDGTIATGVTASHTYTTADVYTVVLVVTDDDGGIGATSQTFTVAPAPNVPPVAHATVSCSLMACSFDGGTSSDADGQVVAYAWDFGDGITATSAAPSHSYTIAGSWPVTLTVTDDEGATGTTQVYAVVAPAPATTVLGSDTFTRTVTNGWGSADLGGAWSVQGTLANYRTTGTTAAQHIALGGGTNTAYLPGVSNANVDVQTRVASSAPVGTTAEWATIVLRKVSTNNEYRLRVHFSSAGVGVTPMKLAGSSSSTLIGTEVTGGLPAYTPGAFYRVRAQAFGTNPTTIRAKVWLDGTPEPSAWLFTRTDATAGIQGAGVTGLTSYGAASTTAVDYTFDDFAVRPANSAPVGAFTASCPSVSCTFDATSSTDDGTITSYQWSFGDGATATGAKPAHIYAHAGNPTVTLTVTDDGGVSSVVSQPVLADAPPTALFTPNCTGQDCSFDASATTDSDNTIASYSWDFGDGTTGTGVTATHHYADTASRIVRLTVTDALGATAQVAHPTGADVPPTAAFTMNCVGPGCSFDAGTSNDPDGNIVSYSWDWHDGNPPASGPNVGRAYPFAGSWPVTLTVTDDQGVTGSVTHYAVVAQPPLPSVYATDAFNRSAAKSLGNADLGGAWTLMGAAANFSVNGANALIAAPSAGASMSARLASVNAKDVDEQARVKVDTTQTGQTWINLVARSQGGNEYRGRLRFGAANVAVGAYKVVGATTSVIGSEVSVPSLATKPNTWYRVRLVTQGNFPTTIKVKVWLDGTPEPAAWNVTVTDATAALQQFGSVGVQVYANGATSYPMNVGVDDFAAQPANLPPVPAFTATCAGALTCNVDGSASTDDGGVARIDWTWGDGTVTQGTTSSHVYSAPGQYTITATAEDGQGGYAVIAKTVTVT